ncbi:2'-5' RNA ligase family protein [Rhizobium sp. CCGE531]|nr:2'-5' RNA ligase family protein [Rhizobium sp. CCGE531]AYG71407.1 2'-5' RNA ligase family protein [Rhizobium sp. CCGE532]
MQRADQMSLDLGKPPIRRKGKSLPKRGQALYFAALPDPEIAKLAAEMTVDHSRRNGLTRTPRKHGLYHVTIYPIDIVSRSQEEATFAALGAGSTICLKSFPLVFDRAGTFGNGNNRQYVLWCREENEGLTTLRRELDAGMQSMGFESGIPRSFQPHMTLFYCDRILPEMRLEEPVTWPVENFTLVNSFQGDGEHGHVWHWPLF